MEPSRSVGSTARRRRAVLYDRLANAEVRVAELEAEVAWRRLAHERESERASAALAAAAAAADALSEYTRQADELAARLDALRPPVKRTVNSDRHAAPSGPLPRLRRAVDAVIADRESATAREPDAGEETRPDSRQNAARRAADAKRFAHGLARDSDALVALGAEKAQLERGGTQTRGPFVPLVPLPSGPVSRPDLRIAGIMDEFSELAFRYEFDYVPLRLDSWERQLSERLPDALLVESAWRGNDGEWRYRVSRPSRAHNDLVTLVTWCRKKGVPTVFWNKEDPVNFAAFEASAQLFDYVFTTDADCIPRYLDLLGHDRVHVLPFAAQPRIHNPIRVGEGPTRSVAFAGTYYAQKHPNRKVQMEVVVDPAREYGLEIFSRVTGDPKYEFPERYRPHIVGSLSYRDVLTAHKMYRIFLNVNSVVGSTSMCARRIFELLASGTAVVSGVSPAIAGQLGPGLVQESASADGTREALTMLTSDDDARARTAVLGLRRILARHTYGDRVESIRRVLELERGELTEPTVAAIACVDRPDDLRHLVATLRRQSVVPSEVLIVLRGPQASDSARKDLDSNVQFIEAPSEEPVGPYLRRALEMSTSAYVSLFDPKAFYGREYLRDALDAFRYTDAAFVGKRACYVTTEDGAFLTPTSLALEYTEVGWLEEGSLTFRREALRAGVPGDLEDRALTLFQVACRRAGLKLFATDRFNYVPHGSVKVAAAGEQAMETAVV